MSAKNERSKKLSQGKEGERTDRCPDQEGDEREKTVEPDQENPEGGGTVAAAEPPPDADQTSAGPARGSAEEPPDTSDMMAFTLDSPGGACGVSLGLFSLGLLSVHISIPKQIVLVDSNLVDHDVVKR